MSQDLRSSEEQGDITAESKENFLQKRTKKVEKLPLAQKLDLSPLNGASSGARWEDWHRCSRWQTPCQPTTHVFCRHIDFSLGTHIR